VEKVILITEDEKIGQLVARFIRILLPDAVVLVDEDGLNAVSRAAADQPDFIIIDSQLQQVASDTIGKLLRQNEATTAIPLIGTGPEPKDLAARRLSILTNAWIAKPTPIWSLSQAIQSVMQGSKPDLWAPAPKNWLRLPERENNHRLSLVS